MFFYTISTSSLLTSLSFSHPHFLTLPPYCECGGRVRNRKQGSRTYYIHPIPYHLHHPPQRRPWPPIAPCSTLHLKDITCPPLPSSLQHITYTQKDPESIAPTFNTSQIAQSFPRPPELLQDHASTRSNYQPDHELERAPPWFLHQIPWQLTSCVGGRPLSNNSSNLNLFGVNIHLFV